MGKKSPRSLVLFIFMSVMILVMTVLSIFTADGHHTQMQAKKQALAEAEDAFRAASDKAVPTVTDVGGMVHSATEAGNTVARIQTEYNKHIEDPDATADLPAELAKCFVSDDLTGPSMWFGIADRTCTWTFTSSFSFSGASADVMWVCRDAEDNALLAYTTAVYDAATDKFLNTRITVTQIGNSRMPGETDLPEKPTLPYEDEDDWIYDENIVGEDFTESEDMQ